MFHFNQSHYRGYEVVGHDYTTYSEASSARMLSGIQDTKLTASFYLRSCISLVEGPAMICDRK